MPLFATSPQHSAIDSALFANYLFASFHDFSASFCDRFRSICEQLSCTYIRLLRIQPYPAISGYIRPCPSISSHIPAYPLVFWPYPAISGQISPYPAIPGHIRSYPAIRGHICGHIRPYPAISDHIQPYLATLVLLLLLFSKRKSTLRSPKMPLKVASDPVFARCAA